jgi:hypothetical protein
VRVRDSGSAADTLWASGITCKFGCSISESIATGNSGYGFNVGSGSSITDSVSRHNRGGIHASDGSVIAGNVVMSNGHGISADRASVILHNAISHHPNFGIFSSTGGPYAYGQNTLEQNNASAAGAGGQVDHYGVQIGPNLCGGDTTCP